ncbi:choline/ethanolamine kinase-like isoform X1 [Argiope bruennichi]|uniref:choline/ethanolamine kinase-like isoform X1 n=1 Tax=Argiope bruennichi TaxID=94029 RepID=UPI0024943B86|nr:choline/ethanolamine kinase-like isoform X1 [Argiope bruennichi]
MTTVCEEELENAKKEALRICRDFLGDIWDELPLSEFKFSPICEGLCNTLYRCSLPENVAVKKPKTPRHVLLRYYGYVQENITVVVTETTIFSLLAERKLGPKLYGVFHNGRLEEFIPSRTVLCKDYRRVYPAVAREMAKIHALDVPMRKIPDFFPVNFKKFLNEVQTNSKERKNSDFEYLDFYTEEAEWLMKEMKKSKSPVVYCHNDLVGGNILLRDDSPSDEDPRIMLIDFEWGAYNYRGFDLANHLGEWCFDYSTSEYPCYEYYSDRFPSEEEQISFIRAYLDQLVEEGVFASEFVEDEIKVILQEIKLFRMAAHLLWSLWSYKMTFQPNRNFGYEEHFKTRFNIYKTLKEKFLNRTKSVGDSESNH